MNDPAAKDPETSNLPARQLQDLPPDELRALAEELGIDPSEYRTAQHLVSAVHDRRQLIATFDREAMLDVIRWARRSVPVNAGREQLAQEIVRIKSMKFDGISERGLMVLARLRGLKIDSRDSVPDVIRKLSKQEGFFARMNRKRRAWIGGMVAGWLGDTDEKADAQYTAPQEQPGTPPAAKNDSIADDIEEQGLLGGIAGRLKKSADSYLNQKLDEIEARIDRKLDEIDRRLADWRDKEIANRLRILKITLWASIVVSVGALIYSYVKVNFFG